jgi:hypothetical protein
VSDRGYTRNEAGALEKRLDKTLRDLDEIRDALVEKEDPEEALERTLTAMGVVNNFLNKLALKRARRYLRGLRSRKRRP